MTASLRDLRLSAALAVESARQLERETGDYADAYLLIQARKFLADVETRLAWVTRDRAKGPGSAQEARAVPGEGTEPATLCGVCGSGVSAAGGLMCSGCGWRHHAETPKESP